MLRDGEYNTRPASGVYNTGSTQIAATGTRGRLFTITVNVLGAAAVGEVNIRNGNASGTIIYEVWVPNTAGEQHTVSFPTGLSFTDGLYVEEVTGNLGISVAYTIDYYSG